MHKSSTLLRALPLSATAPECCSSHAVYDMLHVAGYLLFMPNDKSNVSRKSKFSQNIINLKALELAINARQAGRRKRDRERGKGKVENLQMFNNFAH